MLRQILVMGGHPFKLLRASIAQRAVQAMWVVPAFDPSEQGAPRVIMRGKVRTHQQLAFERCKEAFTHGVVISIARRSHRGLHPGVLRVMRPADNCGASSLLCRTLRRHCRMVTHQRIEPDARSPKHLGYHELTLTLRQATSSAAKHSTADCAVIIS